VGDAQRPVVIVGGSIAGLTAAETYRSLRDDPVVVLDADPHAPYDRTALSKNLLLDEVDPEAGVALRSADDLRRQGIELRLGVNVTGLDTERAELVTSEGRQPYSSLLIATGASPIVPFPVDPEATVHLLRNLDDARTLRGDLRRGSRLIVIGGGLIGCEVASAGRDLGLETTLIALDAGPFALALGELVADRLRAVQQRAGVTGVYGRQVERVRRDGAEVVLDLAGGGCVRGDVVVAGTGVRANTGWLEGSGVALDRGVLCDERFRTNVAQVFAAGDVARWPGGPSGELVRLEHWTAASDQGAAAAHVMAAHAGVARTLPQPYFMTHVHGCRLQMLGHALPVDEIHLLDDERRARSFAALYRRGTRVVGLLAVNHPRLVSRTVGLLDEQTPWDEAVEAVARLMAPTAPVPAR
jgi:NADPH-dependent 2,4-dienoyl-CoA reductase/sulfur reductase-like enzyme